MIKFKCEFCDQRLGVPDDFVGKRVRCTKCRAVNQVPTAAESSARDAAAKDAAEAAAPDAGLPVGAPAAPKVALHSPLLDLPDGDGLAGDRGEDDDASSELDVFGAQKAVPAFVQSFKPQTGLPAPVVVSADMRKGDKAGTAFGATLEDELTFDPEPAHGKSLDDSDFDILRLPISEKDAAEDSMGQVDLEGLGF